MVTTFTLLGASAAVSVIILLTILLVFIFEIMMFISVFKNKRISDNARLAWIIGMILLHPIVAIIYYFTDHQKTDDAGV